MTTLCIRLKEEPGCKREVVPLVQLNPVQVVVARGLCDPSEYLRTLATKSLGKFDSDGALDRARKAMIDAGYFSELELQAGTVRARHRQVTLLAVIEDYPSLCEAAGIATTARPNPGSGASGAGGCPSNPNCFERDCTTRSDGCYVCTCTSPNAGARAASDILRGFFR
jgi:hypothetical protein